MDPFDLWRRIVGSQIAKVLDNAALTRAACEAVHRVLGINSQYFQANVSEARRTQLYGWFNAMYWGLIRQQQYSAEIGRRYFEQLDSDVSEEEEILAGWSELVDPVGFLHLAILKHDPDSAADATNVVSVWTSNLS